MAVSTCVKCGGHQFEMVVGSPMKANYKQNYLQCTVCGGVAGVVGFYDAGVMLEKQAKQITALSSDVDELRSMLVSIINAMRSR